MKKLLLIATTLLIACGVGANVEHAQKDYVELERKHNVVIAEEKKLRLQEEKKEDPTHKNGRVCLEVTMYKDMSHYVLSRCDKDP
jgi:hypothetical protein